MVHVFIDLKCNAISFFYDSAADIHVYFTGSLGTFIFSLLA